MINYLGDIERWCLKTPTFMLSDIDNKALSEELILNAKRKSYEPSCTFYEDFTCNIDNSPTSKMLLEQIESVASRYFGEVDMVEWWYQIHNKGESSNQHNHFGATTSWVYWCKIPDGAGKFTFVINDYASVMSEIDPVEGMLMFFPSWVMHKVTRNTSDDVRISIAGNIR